MSTPTPTPMLNPLPTALESGTTGLYPLAGFTQFSIATVVIAVLALALRFWARYLSPRTQIGLDDWLALLAGIPILALMAIFLAGQHHGLGQHTDTVPVEDRIAWAKMLYASHILWHVGTSLLRFSALAFYARIFRVRKNPSRTWTFMFWFTLGLAIVWLMAVIMMDAFLSCHPISRFWTPSEPGWCAEEFHLLLGGTTGAMVTDIMVIILPLPQVFRLKLQLRRKLAISLSFLLGYGAAFMSIGRLILCLQLGEAITIDPLFFLVPYLYWNIAEGGFTIVAICLPAIFQLTKYARSRGPGYLLGKPTKSFTSDSGTINLTSRASEPSAAMKQLDWDNLYDGHGFGTFVVVSAGHNNDPRPDDMEMLRNVPDSINVRQDVRVTRTKEYD